MSFYDNQNNEIINVTLKNSRGSKTAPLTTTEQVLAHDIFNSGTDKRLDRVLADIYSVASSARCEANSAYSYAYSAESSASYAYGQANSAYSKASEAYDRANSAYCLASDAYSLASNAYNEASDAYDQATNAYWLANDAIERANDAYDLASSTQNNLDNHIHDTNIHWASYEIYNIAAGAASYAYDQANEAYDLANGAYEAANGAYEAANLALDLLNLSQSVSGTGGTEGTYTLKATVSNSGSVTITWVKDSE